MLKREWEGDARRATDRDFELVAKDLGVEERVIRAVWEVEAAGQPFQPDGSLTRRFEPHKLKRPVGNWRTSMKISKAAREQMFLKAYAKDPEDAMSATSWGSPQIMGFNHMKAGYMSASVMVELFADDEAEQLRGFASLIRAFGLISALKAHDWHTFALRYNGNANAADYAPKMESAYRRLGGKASPVVLGYGSEGEAVRVLQRALGIKEDGHFGPATRDAVIEFQTKYGLTADGVVGAVTWGKITDITEVKPKTQETQGQRLAAIGEYVALGSTASGAVATLGASLPESTMNIVVIGMMIVASVGIGIWCWRRFKAS